MKRLLLFLSVILLPFAANAQRTFQAGLQLGINGTQVHGDNYSGFHKAGVVGGAFVGTDPTQKVFWRMEMQYTMKGSKKYARPSINDYQTFELRMNYIEIPMVVGINYRKFFFEAGLAGGALINMKVLDANGLLTPGSGYRKWELATVAGLGMKLNDQFDVNVRFTNSLLPVYQFYAPVYYSRRISNLFNRGMYHNVLGISLYYHFQKKNNG